MRLFLRTFVVAFAFAALLAGIVLVAHADNGPDVVVGTNGPDKLVGGHGPDVLIGKAGDDRLWLGRGPDEAYCGRGFDVVHNVWSTGNDYIAPSCEVVKT
ncbi:MAG: hypothetical protein M3P18_06950 [Actinomycetota bacterium]|nr:hypothetical protein [Actinomycetota bacterium]